MANRQQRNPLGLPSRKDALDKLRREQFLECLGNGKTIQQIESEDALEED